MITRKGVALVGDEPHYLAISQSLARDFDLNVFNQYFRDGFKEFLAVEKLAAHGTFGKGYKKLYSYHLPGISLTLAPFFLVKLPPAWLYFLMRSYLGHFRRPAGRTGIPFLSETLARGGTWHFLPSWFSA